MSEQSRRAEYLEGVRHKDVHTQEETYMLYRLSISGYKFADLQPRPEESHDQVMSRVFGEIMEAFDK